MFSKLRPPFPPPPPRLGQARSASSARLEAGGCGARARGWNLALGNAERLVGLPTQLASVRDLVASDTDWASVRGHLRKLAASSHPVLAAAKRLVAHQGEARLQLRGLIVLLLARAAGGEVTEQQRRLAEIVEMVHTGHTLHQSVLNLPAPGGEQQLDTEQLQLDTEQLQLDTEQLRALDHGNKLAVLGGDLLLAAACSRLAALRTPRVLELVSVAIAEMAQAEFEAGGPGVEQWEARARLGSGSLLAAGCQGALLLAGRDEAAQARARDLGHSLALALRAHEDRLVFTREAAYSAAFSLELLPVLLHLQREPGQLDQLQLRGAAGVNYAQLRAAVCGGGALAATQQVCGRHAAASLELISGLGEGEAASALARLAATLLE